MSFLQQLMDGFAATWCPGRRSGLQWNCAGKARRSWKLVRSACGNCFCTWFARRIHVRLEMLARNPDRKSTRLNSSHGYISYAVFCLKKKKNCRGHLTVPETADPTLEQASNYT